MLNKIKNILKKNIRFIVIYVIILILLLIEFPYYVEAPGGIIDISKRINIENSYKSEGSLNLSYVSEYKATIITLVISLFNKDYKVLKINDVVPDNVNNNDYEFIDKLRLKEAYSNAIFLAYQKAGKDVKIKNEEIYVGSIFDEAKTTLEVGDQIIEVNDIKVNSKEEIDSIISKNKIGDEIKIKIIRNGKEEIKNATLIEYVDKPIIGIIVSRIRELETNPQIYFKYKDRESGSSGGLMLALSIYNNLVKEDITKGRTIVGTGTIDEYGNVGSIGGVEYKLKGAVKAKADIFLVPNGENYEEVIKIKKEKGYKIKIKGVSTFDEALEYLLTT